MSIQIAQLNSNVWLGLGKPDRALCDLDEIHYAVRNAVSLHTQQLRSSDNNQILSVTNTFKPTSASYDISNLVENGTEAWLEVKKGERWESVRVVNKAFLEDMYRQGINACAFYGDEDTARRFVEFSFTPGDLCRIWYDRDIVGAGLTESVINIPDTLTIYFELQAQNVLIPRIKKRLAEQIESEENRKLLAPQLDAWNGIFTQNMVDIAAWRRQFEIFKNRARGSQNQSRLPGKSGKHLYGN